MVSQLFDPEAWRAVPGFDFADITYHRAVGTGAVRVAFNRPEVRNAFRPRTVDELYRALDHARMSSDVGCVILTGNGPSPKDGGWAFCSGGDQRIRGKDGYKYADGETAQTIDPARAGRLHILEVQRLIRFMPKVVLCAVPGWAAGGGHSLHVVCDLTLASAEHARFKQTDADVGSFDGGFGSAYLARQVGPGRALREPSVPPLRGTAQRRFRRTTHPDRHPVLAGTRGLAGVAEVTPEGGVDVGVLVGERLPDHVDGGVGDRAPVGDRGASLICHRSAARVVEPASHADSPATRSSHGRR